MSNAMPETQIWKVDSRFRAYPDFMNCEITSGVTAYPEGALDLEIKLWNLAVEKKKEQMKDQGIELKLEDVEGRKALWGRREGKDDFAMIMVPGSVYRLAEFDAERQVLMVERAIYSEIEALKDPGYRKLFSDAGLPLPNGPIAPALYILTLDGYVVATKRGKGTNKFPGAIYTIGGDIDDPSLTVGEHLLKKEAIEEFKRFGGLSQQPIALGITFDKVLKKHDIPVITTYNTVFDKIQKGKKYLPDIDSITKISARKDELSDYLVQSFLGSLDSSDERWIGRPVPSCHVGLFMVGEHLYGKEWAGEVLRKIS